MLTRICILYFILSAFAPKSRGQVEKELQNLEALPVDEDASSESIEDDRFVYELEDLQRLNLSINQATESDLVKIPFLSPVQIGDILMYRRLVGKLISKYELQAIPSLDSTSVRYLTYIFDFDDKGEVISPRNGRFFTYFYYPFPQSKGMRDGDYLGIPLKVTSRLRYSSPRYDYAACFEQDVGEQLLFNKNQLGFDHSVGFFKYKPRSGVIDQIILGNFTAQIGQGLAIWQRFAMNNANGSSFIKRAGATLAPFTSVAEYNYMRGLAMTMSSKRMECNLWASAKPIDASLQVDTLDGYSYFENFNATGLHRTQNELDKRMVVNELSAGVDYKYKFSSDALVGLYMIYNHYDKQIIPADNYYSWYRFGGNELYFTGAYFSYRSRFWNTFGEVSIQNMKHCAANLGMIFSVNRKLDFSAYIKMEDSEFQSIYSNSFLQKNLTPQNQYYLGLDFYPKYKSKISLFVNHIRYLQFRYLLPDFTEEWSRGITYQRSFSKKESLNMRYTNRFYPRHTQADQLKSIDYKQQHQFKVSFNKDFSKKFSWDQALYYSYLRSDELDERNYGYAVTQSFTYDIGFNTRLKLRLAYFENDNFLNRIYAFEPNIPYQYSLRFFNGKGYQVILNLRQKISKNAAIYARYFLQTQPGSTSLGSGYDETIGPNRQNLSFMYQLNF